MPYVVNLASNDESLRAKSVEHVSDALRAAAEIGAAHYVVHPGSGSYSNFLDSFDKIISASAVLPVNLLIENTEGSGNKLMGAQEQMLDFIDKFGGEAKFCWDTAHAFGAGVDTLKMPAALKSAVKLIHLNDSKVDFGSKKDRHDGFYTGAIGIETIGLIIESFMNIAPFIIEREGHEATCRDLLYIKKIFNKN
jgi:deoxyribonuclease-4